MAAAALLGSALSALPASAAGASTTSTGSRATHHSTPGPSRSVVPTNVHALANNASATVTWSGPTSVDGSATTSWTVTASTGQSVVAHQPNHWAIVTGLSNGTKVSFGVTATSSAGTTAASASSNMITPEPIAPPTHVLLGKPKTVTYDHYSLIIGGRRTFIYSGEFDPWRTPSPSLWLDRLEEMKAAGFNAVTPYFNWDYTSPAPGVYNFSGVRDMNLFMNDAQKVGLYVIARPGPYINAETDGGGFPGWLVTQSGAARYADPGYLAAAEQWFSEIDPIIAAHQVTRGGDVILYQVENENQNHSPSSIAYMQALEAKVASDGINVPTLANNFGSGVSNWASGPGATDLYGTDLYPLGFNCANTSAFGTPPNVIANHDLGGPNKPLISPEYQGGSFNGWGSSATYKDCRTMTGSAFENVYYKNNLAQGMTIQSNYMTVGGTNWGWLPAPFMYSSYDYGAAITQAGQLPAKYRAEKLVIEMTQAVAPLTETSGVSAPAPSNPAVYAMERTNPTTGTQFLYLAQSNAPSTATVTTQASFSTSSGTIPVQGNITLRGREAKLLVANWAFGHQDLVYSTSEVATQAKVSGGRALLLYGDKGTDGETVLHYAAQPTVQVLSGTVQSTWSPASGNLRLDYVHSGLAEVRVSEGGHSLLLLIGTHATAEQFWKLSTPSGSVLVRGADLVRTAQASLIGSGGHEAALLSLTGDTKAAGPIRIWGPAPVVAASWDGVQLALSHHRDGSVSSTLSGPPAISVPALTNWRFSYEAPERLLNYNDSSWPVADHMSTTNPTKPVTLPVLYADDYGFHHGFTWYRGHFTATSTTTGITLTGDGGQYGAFSVWLNGVFLGSNTSGGQQQQTFSFPFGALHVGGDNVVSVLVESMGHNEDGGSNDAQKRPRGLLGATFTTSGGSAAPAVTWRLEGNKGGTNLQDPTRGVMNPAGLYGTNHGWELPHYPSGSWAKASLPSSFAKAGLPPGIGWYRTTFNLSLPKGVWAPMGLKLSPIHGGKPGAGKGQWQAFIYLNGWMVGRYVNYLGPQQLFYLPQGILHVNGQNTLAIATWSLQPGAGGLGKVSLVPYTVREGGIPVSNVAAPGFSAAIYGKPVRPANPVLSLSSASSTVLPTKAFVVRVSVTNAGEASMADARLSLELPTGWTASGGGVLSFGTIPAGASRSQTVTVVVPAVTTPGAAEVLGRLSYRGAPPDAAGGSQGGTQSVLAGLAVTVPEPLSATLTPSSAVLTPGGSTNTQLAITDNWPEPVTANWSAAAPSGVTVTPSSGTASLAAGGTSTASMKVAASASITSGSYPVPTSLQAGVGGQVVASGTTTFTVDVPTPLASTFDNVGISLPSDPGAANFDASGYSFPEPALVADGAGPGQVVTAGGLFYTMPNVPAGQADNTLSDGQVVAVSGQGNTLGFLEASGGVTTSPGYITGTGQVIYADGSTSSFTVNFGNYYYPAANGNVGTLSVPYLDNPSGPLTHTSYIFTYTVPINPAKAVVAVELPPISGVNVRGPGAAHVFALAVGNHS